MSEFGGRFVDLFFLRLRPTIIRDNRVCYGLKALMNTGRFSAILLIAVLVGVPHAADRKWQTGTWTDMGVKRTPWVADSAHEGNPPGFNRPMMTEVATYVIETTDRRFELQDMVAIGSAGFDLNVKVGTSVTFAVEKKTAYIKLDGGEYRLLVLKSEPKKM